MSAYLVQFAQKCTVIDQEQEAAMQENDPFDCFKGLDETFMAYTNDAVIKHFPPRYIIGRQIGAPKEIAVGKHELINIRL